MDFFPISEIRYCAYKDYNFLLEIYYNAGELLGRDSSIRENDIEIWKREGKIETPK